MEWPALTTVDKAEFQDRIAEKNMARHLCCLALTLILVVTGCTAHAEDAAIAGSNGGAAGRPGVFGQRPRSGDYGAATGFPVATQATAGQVDTLVGTYSHFDELFPSRPVKRAATPWLFKRAAEPPIFTNSDRIDSRFWTILAAIRPPGFDRQGRHDPG